MKQCEDCAGTGEEMVDMEWTGEHCPTCLGTGESDDD